MSSSSSSGRWNCRACSFSNVPATLSCEICQTSRMNPVQVTPIASGGGGSGRLERSEIVQMSQESANYVTPPASSSLPSSSSSPGWACSLCSLSNPLTVSRCQACDSPRPPTLQLGKNGTAATTTKKADDVIMPVQVSRLKKSATSASSTPPPPATTTTTTTTNNGRAKPAPSAALAPGQFQCQACTFINTSPTALACEICGAARTDLVTDTNRSLLSSSSSSSPAPSSTWTCSVDGVLNSIDEVRCTVCRALSPLAPRGSAPVGPSVPSMPRTARGEVVPLLAASEHKSGAQPQVAPLAVTPVVAAHDALIDPTGEREAAEQWREIMAVCGATKNVFTDDSFRPGDRAIFGSSSNSFEVADDIDAASDRRPTNIRQRGPFGWKRGRQVTKESAAPWCVLPFKPDGTIDVKPQDIKQGQLGNCYFISALSVLAERPKLIEHLILTPELNDVGAYQIRFCKNGAWRTITVDDYFPVDPISGRLAFAHTPSNELWVPLIEKAYAKLHSSYAAIESGSVADAFAELTGAPSERIDLHIEEMSKYAATQAARWSCNDPQQHRDMLWATLLSFRQSRFLMGASCGRRHAKSAEYEQVGLREDHAYAILDARFENGVQLIQLRNPWGSVSWNGDWSANSPLWTPQLRKLLNYPLATRAPSPSLSTQLYQLLAPSPVPRANTDVAGGVFWMCFDDFLKYFRTIDVCKYQDDWQVIRLRDEFPIYTPPQLPSSSNLASGGVPAVAHSPWTPNYMYELTIPQSTWCFISLIQADLRGSNAPKPYKYHSMGVFILKSKTPQPIEANLQGYQRCNEVFPETQRIITCETLLTDPHGRYLVLPCSYASVISSHTGMALPSAGRSNEPTFPFILTVYSAHPILIKRRPIFIPAITIAKQLATIRGESKPLSEGGLWFVVVNRHPTKYLSITLDLSQSVGLIPSRGTLKTQDYIPPQHRQLLMAIVTPRASQGYSYHRACTFIHVDGVSGALHTPLLRSGYDCHQPVRMDQSFVPIIV